MPITGLFHVAIKTNDLAVTCAFYERVLGLKQAHRPDFGFPGAWLAVPTPVGEAVIHVYAGGPVMAAHPGGKVPPDTGAIDHLSITAVGWESFRRRFTEFGLPWREFVIPGTTYWQQFVYDPSGVQLELTFDGVAEGIPTPDIPEAKRYRPGDSFFAPAAYATLTQSASSPQKG